MPVIARGATSKVHLELLIPGLLGPAPEAEQNRPPLSVPMLETLLARSDRLSGEYCGEFEGLMFNLFNIGVDEGKDLPVAAVTRALDLGVIDSGWWLRADPVHLRPARDRLILADSTQLHLRQEEADQLVAEIMDAYAGDGWILKAACPERWYLKPPAVPDIRTTPLPAVVSRDIHDHLPQGADAKLWHTILNELQILLHTARTNSEREQRGELPVNSLWFWGGGRLPELHQPRWRKVWTTESLSVALARLSETRSAPPPVAGAEWLAQLEGGGDYLLVLDGARVCVQYGNAQDWQNWLQALEENWLTPLMAGLKQGAVDTLTLRTDAIPAFRLNARRARRWWRRRRPLGSYH